MKVIALVILLAAGFSCSRRIGKPFAFLNTPKAYDISGIWINELNSTVIFYQDDSILTGYYCSLVGQTGQRFWPLRGITGNTQPSAFGFVVTWLDGASSTAWSGQSQFVDGRDVLLTTWILTSKTLPEDNWQSTLVGKDTFYRYPIPEEEFCAFSK